MKLYQTRINGASEKRFSELARYSLNFLTNNKYYSFPLQWDGYLGFKNHHVFRHWIRIVPEIREATPRISGFRDWGFPLMSLSHNMVRLPHPCVEQVAWLWKGGWGSKIGVPLFPIAYQYLNCSFQAWALHVDVSRANHSFRCLFGSFLTWLWSFSNRWEAVTFLVEIHLFRISLSLICL